MKVNPDVIKALLSTNANDQELIELILDCLESFESYHKSIYTMELQRRLYLYGAMDSDTYREKIPYLDQVRSANHNSVINNVRILNRLAEQAHLAHFYDGIVSEERPYRTELADAILDFVRDIIDSRIKGQ